MRKKGLSCLRWEFQDTTIMDDHYLNPIKAPESLLSKFPPTCIVVGNFDFCLDDCVTLAKKLQ